jgi:hypothetical protein
MKRFKIKVVGLTQMYDVRQINFLNDVQSLGTFLNLGAVVDVQELK